MPDVTTAPPRRPGTFPPGVSGNPSGRPKGAINCPQEALDALLRRAGARRHGKHLVNALVAAARGGDANAAAVLLDAILRTGEAPR
jgi:hypothetical protein